MEGGGKEGKKGGRKKEVRCVCVCVCVCVYGVCVCVCAQSCLTLCDPKDCSWPDSSVHGIFQARILEWVAISYSRGYSQPRDRTHTDQKPNSSLSAVPIDHFLLPSDSYKLSKPVSVSSELFL